MSNWYPPPFHYESVDIAGDSREELKELIKALALKRAKTVAERNGRAPTKMDIKRGIVWACKKVESIKKKGNAS